MTENDSSPCKTQEVLTAAQKDLDNAEWPGVLGQIADPVKSNIVSPVLNVATHVIPAVSSHIPLLDDVSSMMLGATFQVIKVGYGVLPHVPSLHEQAQEQVMDATEDAREQVKNEGENDSDLVHKLAAIPGVVVSFAKFLIGYSINATLDVVTAPEDKVRGWKETSEAFVGYLKQYGIDDELKGLLLNPRTDTNMLIMSRIQNDLDRMSDRRSRTALPSPVMTAQGAKDLYKLASRFIKYSVAAYGVYSIESVEEARKLVPQLSSSEDQEPEKTTFLDETGGSLDMDRIMDAKIGRIARFLGIEKSDIHYATAPGGGLKIIGHFVAVDHETKSVVLAVRGTHNTSEWVADFDAMAVPFCGGVAHKGMAERALNLWENRDTRNAIVRALYQNQGYQLVVTGQSLGSGVANLVHLKCHHSGENLFQGKKTVCFAFGGPPVFAYTAAGNKDIDNITEAFATCYNYIHGNDMVAHASVDAVRRVIHTLDDLDSLTSQMSPVDRFMLVRGAKKPSDEMIQVVRDGSIKLKPKPGANRLKLPGKFIVWFKKVSKDPLLFDTYYCDPNAVSDLGILVSIDMCTDHLPVAYELSLEAIGMSD